MGRVKLGIVAVMMDIDRNMLLNVCTKLDLYRLPKALKISNIHTRNLVNVPFHISSILVSRMLVNVQFFETR